MKNKINIAIDGPSGSGKSTIAKLLAKKYHLTYINTGLVYRAMAFNAKILKKDFSNEQGLIDSLNLLSIKLLPNEEVELNSKLVTKELRADDISQKASQISAIPVVRKLAVSIQQKAASKKGVIMEGRDTTFVVLLQADVKIYLDTDAETRAKRRVNQNKELGFNTNYQEILAEIKQRDYRDMNRKTDPLHKTADAIYINASNMKIHDVIDRISIIVDKLL